MGVYNLVGQIKQTHLKSEVTIQKMLQKKMVQSICQMGGIANAMSSWKSAQAPKGGNKQKRLQVRGTERQVRF
jgi:hypothetical protein